MPYTAPKKSVKEVRYLNKDFSSFKNNLIENNGIIILHRNKNSLEKLPNYFKTIDERIYGISKIIFGRLLP